MNSSHRIFLTAAVCAPWILACGSDETAALTPRPATAKVEAARLLPASAGPLSSDAPWELRALDPSARLARLVPEDAVVWIQASSFDDLDRLCDQLRLEDSSAPDLDGMLRAAFAPSLRWFDRTRPIGVAVSMSDQAEPLPTLIVPVKDDAAFVRSLALAPSDPAPALDGDYVALSRVPLYARPQSIPALAVVPGDPTILVRVDLERVMERFGPWIEAGLLALPESGIAAWETPPEQEPAERWALAGVASVLGAVVRGADRAELSFDLDGELLRCSASLRAIEGGPLDGWGGQAGGDLGSLARGLSPTDAGGLLLRADEVFLRQRLVPWLVGVVHEHFSRQGVPIELGEAAVAAKLASILAFLGPAQALSANYTLQDTAFAVHFLPRDPRTVVSEFEALLRAGDLASLGFALDGPVRTENEGLPMTEFTLRLEESLLRRLHPDDLEFETRLRSVRALLETWFGDTKVRVRIVVAKARAVLVIGGGDAWLRRTLVWISDGVDHASPEVQRALKEVGGACPAFVSSMDVARWSADMQEIIVHMLASRLGKNPEWARQQLPAARHGGPCSLTLFCAIEGREWRAGFVVRPEHIANMSKLQRMANDGSEASPALPLQAPTVKGGFGSSR